MESSIPKGQNEVRAGAAHGNTLADTGWLDRFFASYYARRPVNATFIGVHEWDDRLPDFSEHGAGDTLADMQNLLVESGKLRDVAGPLAKVQDGGLVSFEGLDRRARRGIPPDSDLGAPIQPFPSGQSEPLHR